MADARLSEAVAAATNTTTNTTSNLLVFLLPRVLSLTSTLLGDSSENTTVLTREILDVASKVFTVDGTSSLGSLGINPVLLDFSSAMWPLYLITVPLLIGAIIWYFITTFVLGKNVLGRNLFSSKERQEEEAMDVLTKRVIWAFEEPKYT